MRWNSLRLVLAVGLCVLLQSSMASAQGRRGRRFQDRDAIANGWQFDYEAAKEAARRSKKPLMVVFRCVP